MPDQEFRSWELQTAREVGLFAMKALVTLNGGAFVVLLTFLGNSEANSQFSVGLGAIKFALSCFTAGLLAPMLILLLSYLSAVPADGVGVKRFLAQKIVAVNIVLAVLALIAFTVGVASIIWSTSTA